MILPRWGDGIWPVDETYKRMTKFWDKLFVINFALILVPIVLLYQGWSYWVFRKRIGREDSLEY